MTAAVGSVAQLAGATRISGSFTTPYLVYCNVCHRMTGNKTCSGLIDFDELRIEGHSGAVLRKTASHWQRQQLRRLDIRTGVQ